MDKPNQDISTLCKKYFHNEMSVAERKKFESLISNKPELRKEFDFFLLMYKSLKIIDAEKENNINHSSSTKKSYKKIIAVLIFLLLIGFFVLFILHKAKSNNSRIENQQLQRVSEENSYSPDKKSIEGFGGNSTKANSDRPSGVAWNSKDAIIIVGNFEEYFELGGAKLNSFGGVDIFAAVYTQDSKCLNAWNAGSRKGGDAVSSVTLDSKDNIIITGSFGDTAYFGGKPFYAEGKMMTGFQDFFIAKYTASGDLTWMRHAGGKLIPDLQTGPNIGISVIVDPFDNIIASGMYIGTPSINGSKLPVGGPNEDTYLIKFDSKGNLIWAKAITGSYMSTAYEMDVDEEGNIYLTGYFGHHNLSGSVTFDNTILESYGGRDIFVAKYYSDGRLAWAKQAGSKNLNGRDFGLSISTDAKGNSIVTGFFEGTAQFDSFTITSEGHRDLFIAKYKSNGKVLWVKQAGGSNQNDHGNSVVQDKYGNFYLAGKFSGAAKFDKTTLNSNGKEDFFIAKYDSKGILLWIRQLGGDSDELDSDSANSIAINDSDELVVVGFFSGTMRIGNQILTSSGREDIFILRLDAEGNLLEIKKILYT